MALTVNAYQIGDLRHKFGDDLYGITAKCSLDNSYPTGGYSITPQMFGLNQIKFVIPDNAGGYLYEYIPSTQRLKVYSGPATEVIAGTNLSTVNNLTLLVIGL